MFNIQHIYTNHYDNIIIIGDIHGDLKRFKNILLNENIISNNLEWIKDNIIVIQLGDQIDSANRNISISEWELIKDIEVLEFTNLLSKLAKTKNSLFISLIGNHELMNFLGDFSYVSQNSLYSERINNFKKKGIYNNILADRPIVVKINDLIFCHAGITKNHLDICDKYNKDIFYINNIWTNLLTNNIDKKDIELINKLIFDNNGILWTREMQEKKDVDYVCQKLNCNYIFVGHNTVDKIILHNNIWYTDNCISRSYGKTNYQYIVIDSQYNVNIKSL
tara:strand:- start:310 stop:1143 length:834 start_codon:yes stop_codon:yes gene_type:complete